MQKYIFKKNKYTEKSTDAKKNVKKGAVHFPAGPKAECLPAGHRNGGPWPGDPRSLPSDWSLWPPPRLLAAGDAGLAEAGGRGGGRGGEGGAGPRCGRLGPLGLRTVPSGQWPVTLGCFEIEAATLKERKYSKLHQRRNVGQKKHATCRIGKFQLVSHCFSSDLMPRLYPS